MGHRLVSSLARVLGLAVVAAALNAAPVAAQTRVPSIYDPGCKGLICQNDDPRTQAGPPPPCQGLLCGMTPYSMERPVTAAEAQRIQAERASAAAAAAQAQAPAGKPMRKARHAKGKNTASKAAAKTRAQPVAARTPDPGTPAAAPAQ